MKTSRIIFLATTVITIILAMHFLPESDSASREGTLYMATNVGYPPFVFADEQGDITGFDVELLGLVAKHLGKESFIKHMGFDALIVTLKQAKADLIFGGISITPSRQRQMTMIPYFGDDEQTLSLVFWDEVPAGVTNLHDLMSVTPNPVVSTQTGSTMHEYLENAPGHYIIKTFSDIDEIIMDVRYGKSTAGLVETGAAHSLAKRHASIKVVPFAIDGAAGGVGIGIRKDNEALARSVRDAIAHLKSTGQLQKLIDKWF